MTIQLSSSTTIKRDRSASNNARRQQLIESTIESIAVHGFNKTTLKTVTQIARLSHGVVNFHFKSKDLLLLETMKFLVDEHLQHWRTGLKQAFDNSEAKLKALVATDFDEKIANPKRIAVWFAYWGEVNNRPAYREIADNKDRQRRHQIESLCLDLTKTGGYTDIDAGSFSTNLEAIIDGLWLQILLSPREMTAAKASKNCLTFLAATFPRHFKPNDKH